MRRWLLALMCLVLLCGSCAAEEAVNRALDAANLGELEEFAGEVAPELAKEMLALVRFRLEQTDFLQRPEYGARLLETFAHIRAELPMGYVRFHLPYVLKWYEAARQYRQAYLLRCEFS